MIATPTIGPKLSSSNIREISSPPQKRLPVTNVAKINSKEIVEKIGNSSKVLFSLMIFKLVFVNVQPLLILAKKFIKN